MYHIRIVIDCMLSWKGEGLHFPNAFLVKNQPILMEAGERVLKVDKCPLRNNVMPSYITKFEKRLNGAKHLFRDVSLNRREIHLLRE